MPNHKIIELSSFLVNSHLQTCACNLQDHQIPLPPHQIPIVSLSFLSIWLFNPIGYSKNLKTSWFLNCGRLMFRSYSVILAHQSVLSNLLPPLTAMKNNGQDWKAEARWTIWRCVVASEYITVNICRPSTETSDLPTSSKDLLAEAP